MWAKILYAGVYSRRIPLARQQELARQSLSELDQAVTEVQKQADWYYQFPVQQIDWGRNNYPSMWDKVAHWRGECDKVAAEFDGLLSGHVFMFPETGGL